MSKAFSNKMISAMFFSVLGVSLMVLGTLHISMAGRAQQLEAQEIKLPSRAEYIEGVRVRLLEKMMEREEFQAQSILVKDLTENKVVFSSGSQETQNLASVTKILTAHTALSLGMLEKDVMVTVDRNDIAQVGDQGFEDGDTFRLNDAVDMLLVASSNDMASALAHAFPEFNETMISHIRSLGLKINVEHPSGYDFGDETRASTATPEEIIMFAEKFAHDFPERAQMTLSPEITIENTDGEERSAPHSFKSLDLLTPYADDIRLMKTGFTNLAGGNVLVIGDWGGHRVGMIIMGSTYADRNLDIATLIGTVKGVYEIIGEFEPKAF